MASSPGSFIYSSVLTVEKGIAAALTSLITIRTSIGNGITNVIDSGNNTTPFGAGITTLLTRLWSAVTGAPTYTTKESN